MRASEPSSVRRARSSCHVGRGAHEGESDEVGARLRGEREIGYVLVGDGRQLRPGEGHVDPLARGQRTGRDDPGEHLARFHAFDRQTRDAVADHDLRAFGDQAREVREVDEDPVGIARLGIAGEDDHLARRHGALAGVRRQPQLWPLQVEEQAQWPSRPPGRGAHLAGPTALVVGGAVGAVQPRAIDPRRNHPVEYPGGVGGGAQRGHDLGASVEHARYPAACVLVRLARGGMRSVIVPSAISAAKPTRLGERRVRVDRQRRCPRRRSPTSIASTASAISSPALGPTMPAPSSRRVPGSTRSFVRPSARPMRQRAARGRPRERRLLVRRCPRPWPASR